MPRSGPAGGGPGDLPLSAAEVSVRTGLAKPVRRGSPPTGPRARPRRWRSQAGLGRVLARLSVAPPIGEGPAHRSVARRARAASREADAAARGRPGRPVWRARPRPALVRDPQPGARPTPSRAGPAGRCCNGGRRGGSGRPRRRGRRARRGPQCQRSPCTRAGAGRMAGPTSAARRAEHSTGATTPESTSAESGQRHTHAGAQNGQFPVRPSWRPRVRTRRRVPAA